MGFIRIPRQHLVAEPCQQLGGISFRGAVESQPRSNDSPLGFPRPPMPVVRIELCWGDVELLRQVVDDNLRDLATVPREPAFQLEAFQ
jgi:hypothetical protein